MDEGYIKFEVSWSEKQLPADPRIANLVYWRQQLYQLGLIGAYPDGIGYGNISMRCVPGQVSFYISGSATGLIPEARAHHFSLVTAADIPSNRVYCEGPVVASSESMSHAAIYATDPEINWVMHLHHKGLWQQYLGILPTTPPEVPYGSPEMADSLRRLILQPENKNQRVLVTAGHEEGLFAFGKTPTEAFEAIHQLLNNP